MAAFKFKYLEIKTPGNGEARVGSGVWAVGVVRARGGVGTHWQPLNTL